MFWDQDVGCCKIQAWPGEPRCFCGSGAALELGEPGFLMVPVLEKPPQPWDIALRQEPQPAAPLHNQVIKEMQRFHSENWGGG